MTDSKKWIRLPFQLLGIILLVQSSPSLTAQPYENLIFEGAGIKGLAYAGAIYQLDQTGIMTEIKRVGGTSAGAITALLVALGYQGEEIRDIVSGTAFQQFNDAGFPFSGVRRMKKKYGWYQGDRFLRWLEPLIEQKTGDPDITFAEMKAQGYRELYVTSTSLKQQKIVILSHETFPNMKVKEAVRISMSIPLYFQAMFVDQDGQVIRKPTHTENLDILVDGGIVANFPIFLFDSTYVGACGQELRWANPLTLAVRIDSDEQIALDLSDKRTVKGLAEQEIHSFSDYRRALYVFGNERLNRSFLIPEDWDRILFVSSVGVDPKIKKMPKATKEALFESGIAGAQEFLMRKGLQTAKDQ